MTTEKQLNANFLNAQHSTGPKTNEGKTIVSLNAIKHGIFTKDLIIASGAGEENRAEYDQLLHNLIECLSPSNQMEALLVEKIAVDFWRLRRIIRFETGSIEKQIENIFSSYYSSERKNNIQIKKEIEDMRESIEWNATYLKCLKKNKVTFDQPTWKGKTVTADIHDDFYWIASTSPVLTWAEKNRLYESEIPFDKLSTLLGKLGYSNEEQIATRLTELYEEENDRLEKEIQELKEQKNLNEKEDQRNVMLGTAPTEENTEKALKYERSIQKSIFQNLFLLKKLQGLFRSEIV